jgi:hypothetical protein
MSKLTELFEAINKYQKEHGSTMNKIMLRKDLYDELAGLIPEDKNKGKSLSLFNTRIDVISMNIDGCLFGENLEFIATVDDRYCYLRSEDGDKANWQVRDLGPSLWDNKFPQYGNPSADELLKWIKNDKNKLNG